ncbi:MAG: divalent-cation tolerance protein CutA [Wenzhouxiangellaceae bacterium]
MSEDALILVHTTCANVDEALRLADALVNEHLAACASIGAPARSVYPWRDEIQVDAEIPLTLKTARGCFTRLARRLRELHSYDVPELLATKVVEAEADYRRWVFDWVRAGADRPVDGPADQ